MKLLFLLLLTSCAPRLVKLPSGYVMNDRKFCKINDTTFESRNFIYTKEGRGFVPVRKVITMIPIKKEPKEMYANTKVYENCVFCHNPTDTWHERTNNPVCTGCAKKHKVKELINWR